MLRSVLTRRRLRTWSPALALAIGAGILAGCASSQANTTTTTTTTSTAAPPTSARTTTSSTPPPTTNLANSKQAVAAAWEASFKAFYEAGERDDPSWPPLLASLYPNSPQLRQEEGFIGVAAAAGVVGPSTWRIGNVVVETVISGQAAVTGCSYDPGAHYKSSGVPAPADLGGGAGYTAYASKMKLLSERWLVYSTTVSAVTSTRGPGPCHGF